MCATIINANNKHQMLFNKKNLNNILWLSKQRIIYSYFFTHTKYNSVIIIVSGNEFI